MRKTKINGKVLCSLFILVMGICILHPQVSYAYTVTLDLTDSTKSNKVNIDSTIGQALVKAWITTAENTDGIIKTTSFGAHRYVDLDKDGNFDIDIFEQDGKMSITPACTGVGNLNYNFIGKKTFTNSNDGSLTVVLPEWYYYSPTHKLFIKGQDSLDKSNEDTASVNKQPWAQIRLNNTVEEIVIGEGITRISPYSLCVFGDVTKITLPSTLKEISSNSMYANYKLTELVIPQNVEVIGSGALASCNKLALITIHNPKTLIGADYGLYPTFPYNNSASLVVKAHTGSPAEAYCKEEKHGIPFETLCTGAPVKENEVAATCTAKGSYEEVRYCMVCKAEFSREKKDIEKLAHTSEDVVTKAKPGADGKTESICKTCKTVLSTTKIAAPKTFTPEKSEFTATGSEIKPSVIVKDADGNLIAPENYKLTYADNILPGTDSAVITIDFTGSAKYEGTAKASFSIKAISVANAEVLIPDQEWTGKPIVPATGSVKVDGKSLTINTDFTVACVEGTNVAVGTAAVEITGKGIYTDKKTASFKIVPKSLAAAKVEADDQTWTGKALTPPVKVTLDSVVLKQEEDYVVAYSSNTEEGTAVLTVVGQGNYKDSATGSFKITKAAVSPTEPAPTEPIITPSNPVKLKTVEKALLKTTDEEGGKNSSFYLLQAKGEPLSTKSIKITWTKVKGATGYIIYGNRCGKGRKYKKLDELKNTSTSWTNKVKKGTYYKVIVVAVKNTKVLAKSKTVHVATNGGKVGNPTGITLNRTKLTLRVSKSKTLKATVQEEGKPVKTHRGVRWESSNPAVATVSSTGTIQAVAKGKCYVYAYAQNGLFARVKVTVKE